MMGILFNISSLWFSVCMTFIIMGKPLDMTKNDYMLFGLGLAIGLVMIMLCMLLEKLFPNNGGWI